MHNKLYLQIEEDCVNHLRRGLAEIVGDIAVYEALFSGEKINILQSAIAFIDDFERKIREEIDIHKKNCSQYQPQTIEARNEITMIELKRRLIIKYALGTRNKLKSLLHAEFHKMYLYSNKTPIQ